jgi:hypothetical protein
MRMVYLLWGGDADGAFIDTVFADKDKAEAAIRELLRADPECHYWIQEKEVI